MRVAAPSAAPDRVSIAIGWPACEGPFLIAESPSKVADSRLVVKLRTRVVHVRDNSDRGRGSGCRVRILNFVSNQECNSLCKARLLSFIANC